MSKFRKIRRQNEKNQGMANKQEQILAAYEKFDDGDTLADHLIAIVAAYTDYHIDDVAEVLYLQSRKNSDNS